MKSLLTLSLFGLFSPLLLGAVVLMDFPIPNGLFVGPAGPYSQTYDFNQDGRGDITFEFGISIFGFYVTGPSTSEVVAGFTNGYYGAAVLGAGAEFSASLLPSATDAFGVRYHSFLTGQEATMSFASSESSGGPWENRTGYLGFSFLSEQGRHYGWIYHQHIGSGFGGYFFQYAYETEPGVGIITGIPEPSSAGLLVLGAGISLLHRSRKQPSSCIPKI
jgi:hypothetical protein